MGVSYKNTNVDLPLSNNNDEEPGGGKIGDLSGSLQSEKISQSSFNSALDYQVRGGGGASASQTNMYIPDRTVEVERFSDKADKLEGFPSMFNSYTIFTHPSVKSHGDIFDKKNGGPFPKYLSTNLDENGNVKNGSGNRELNIDNILDYFDPDKGSPEEQDDIKSTPYYASDFLYARWFEKIPLNHLITLRRYPFPTYDNLAWGEGKNFKPLAQAITYWGEPSGNELKELTKYSGFINWEEMTADVHDVEGNEQGFDSSPFVGNSGKLGTGIKFIGALGNPGGQDLSGRKAQGVDAARYNTFEYTNRVLGPVNVVNKTFVRQRGIGATQTMSLTFEYQLRSYNSINPRLAMLDILCNMLAMTFNNAKFWGGANRYFPNKAQFGFLGDQKAFYDGRYGDYIGSVVKQMGDGLGRGLDIIGTLISGILSGDLSSLMNIGKKAGGALMDLQSHKTRPKALGFHSLLTGSPIGEWHVTIGNPFRPITRIGNLIVESFDLNLDGHLGVDDFPEFLKFVVNLKSGRPRDKGDLESVFNDGQGRIYYPPANFIDVTNSSSTVGAAGLSVQNSTDGGNVGTVDGKTRTSTVGKTFIRAGDDRQDLEFARKLIGTAF